MNILYKNQHGSAIYPFIESTPFPAQCISYVKVALKHSVQIPFVSAVGFNNGQLFVQLSTQNRLLCQFILQDSLYATVNNDNIFGFIKAAKLPLTDFYYKGKWHLSRDCYTFPVNIRGLQKASVNRSNIEQSYLDLQFIGDFTIRQSDDPSVINIGRDTAEAHKDYTQMQQTAAASQPSVLPKYVSSINGMQASQLVLQSMDPTITVSAPIAISSNVYVIYINSQEGFPTCIQQVQSDAAQPDIDKLWSSDQ